MGKPDADGFVPGDDDGFVPDKPSTPVARKPAEPFIPVPQTFGGQVSDAIESLLTPGTLSRVKSNVAPLGRMVAQPFVDTGKSVLAANDAAGRALWHPVDTFGNGKAGAVFREGMRGVNSNIPFANDAVEALGGPSAVSAEDSAKAPGFQALGGVLGTPLAGMVGGVVAKPIEAAAPVLGRALGGLSKDAAVERQATRAVEDLGEGSFKRARAGTKTDVVESAVRENPELRAAAGNDSQVSRVIAKAKDDAHQELTSIYSDSSAARTGLAKDLETLRSQATKARETATELRAKASPPISLIDEARKIDAPVSEEPSLFSLTRQVDAPVSGAEAREAARPEFAAKEAAREAEAKAADDAASRAEAEANRLEHAVSDHAARVASASAPPIDTAVPIAKLDTRISKLRATNIPSDGAAADALEDIRNKLSESLKDKTISPQTLRAIQSDYQRASYGKSMPGDLKAGAVIKANAEASKAVGDAVVRHVTGMDFAEAKAAAAKDPRGVAARLFKANDTVNAANKIDAAIADRASKPQVREGIVGKAQKVAHAVSHPAGLIPGAVDTAARTVDAGIARFGAGPDGMLARVVQAASQGNPFAQKQLRIVAATPAGVSRIAAIQAQLAPQQAAQ